MWTRYALWGAAVSLGVLVAWSAPQPPPQSRTGASEVPCAAPLAWRVARVDDEFGLDPAEATSVVLEAADLWEDAASRPLFVLDPRDGFPVRLVYDERQERTEERRRRQTDLDRSAGELESRGAELVRRAEELDAAQDRHREALRGYESRVAAHNETVRTWNDRGGAPAGEQRRLSAVAAQLEVEREELESSSRELEAEAGELQGRQERLGRDVREHNGRADELARDFPPVSVESGVYREAVRTENGRVVSVGREIRIYRFGSVDELRLVAAHELGHALGLGHSSEPAAVMNPQHEERAGTVAVVGLHGADAELLAELCPELTGGAE